MKGKRYSTEDKTRILRQADGGRTIGEVIREANISEVTFHRWKKPFGQMEVNETKRLKELERENTELKKMLAESLLKNRVLEFVCEKSCESGASEGDGSEGCRGEDVLRASGMPVPEVVEIDLEVSKARGHGDGRTSGPKAAGALGKASPVLLPPDRGVAAPGRLGCGQTPARRDALLIMRMPRCFPLRFLTSWRMKRSPVFGSRSSNSSTRDVRESPVVRHRSLGFGKRIHSSPDSLLRF